MNVESEPVVRFPLTLAEVESHVNNFFPVAVFDREGLPIADGEYLLPSKEKVVIQGLVAINALFKKYATDTLPVLIANPNKVPAFNQTSLEIELGNDLLKAITEVGQLEHAKADQEVAITGSQVLLAQASNVLQEPVPCNVALAKNFIATALVTEANHELRTPLTIIIGMDQTLHLIEEKENGANQPMIDFAAESIQDELPKTEEKFNDLFERLHYEQDPEMHNIHAITSAIEAEFIGRHDAITVNISEMSTKLFGERVQFTDTYLRGLLRNMLRNAVRFSPNNPGAPVEISFDVRKNNLGRECIYITYKDLFGGFKLKNVQEDGTMKKGPDGFQFSRYETTRGKKGDTHVVDSGYEGGLGIGLAENERILFFLDGIRLHAWNHKKEDRIGAAIAIEIPLLPVLFPSRIIYDDTESLGDKIAILARTNGIEPFTVDGGVADAIAQKKLIKQDNSVTVLIPQDLRAQLTDEQSVEQINALQAIDPQVCIVDINEFNFARMIELHSELPNTVLLALFDPHALTLKDQEALALWVDQTENIFMGEHSNLSSLRSLFKEATNKINSIRT